MFKFIITTLFYCLSVVCISQNNNNKTILYGDANFLGLSDTENIEFVYSNKNKIKTNLIIDNKLLYYSVVEHSLTLIDLRTGIELHSFDLNKDLNNDGFSTISTTTIENKTVPYISTSFNIISDSLIYIGLVKKSNTDSSIIKNLLFVSIQDSIVKPIYKLFDVNFDKIKLNRAEYFNEASSFHFFDNFYNFGRYEIYDYFISPFQNHCKESKLKENCRKEKYSPATYFKDTSNKEIKILEESKIGDHHTTNNIIIKDDFLYSNIYAKDTLKIINQELIIDTIINTMEWLKKYSQNEYFNAYLYMDKKKSNIYVLGSRKDSIFYYYDFFKIDSCMSDRFHLKKTLTIKKDKRVKQFRISQIYDDFIIIRCFNPFISENIISKIDVNSKKSEIEVRFNKVYKTSLIDTKNKETSKEKEYSSNKPKDPYKDFIFVSKKEKKKYFNNIVADTINFPQTTIIDLLKSIDIAFNNKQYDYIINYLTLYNKYDYPDLKSINKEINIPQYVISIYKKLIENYSISNIYYASDDFVIYNYENFQFYFKQIDKQWFIGFTFTETH